jgi:hypothetical protein
MINFGLYRPFKASKFMYFHSKLELYVLQVLYPDSILPYSPLHAICMNILCIFGVCDLDLHWCTRIYIFQLKFIYFIYIFSDQF